MYHLLSCTTPTILALVFLAGCIKVKLWRFSIPRPSSACARSHSVIHDLNEPRGGNGAHLQPCHTVTKHAVRMRMKRPPFRPRSRSTGARRDHCTRGGGRGTLSVARPWQSSLAKKRSRPVRARGTATYLSPVPANVEPVMQALSLPAAAFVDCGCGKGTQSAHLLPSACIAQPLRQTAKGAQYPKLECNDSALSRLERPVPADGRLSVLLSQGHAMQV